MAYIIDGHNLIPNIPGMSLQALDDENQLILLLQDFCRHERKEVHIYFDNAPAGSKTTQRFGLVTAHFVRTGSTADKAIKKRLASIGKAAVNWTVISSDREVQSAARSMHAKVISAQDFARLLTRYKQGSDANQSEPRDIVPNDEEIDDWLHLFGQGGKSSF